MAIGDYPCWVYDPTGVNPPVFVKDDPTFVALLNTPLPSTALPGGANPTTAINAPAVVVPPAAPVMPVAGVATVAPLGAKFTRTPQTGGRAPAPVIVNSFPHVAGKR